MPPRAKNLRATWALSALVVIVGCGGRSALVEVDGVEGPSEGAGADAGGSGDDGSGDGSTNDEGNGCFELREGLCSYVSANAPGFACTEAPGFTMGSCPSSGLVGCCVIVDSMGGVSVTAAQCYYSSEIAASAQSACMGELMPGDGSETWQTTSP